MQFTFSCAHCRAMIEVDATACGEQATCPGCGELVVVPMPEITSGAVLGGFRLERKIGSGGMGEVFLATQLSMNRKVAVKVLPQAMSKGKDEVARFIHEARMAARLEHPNVVTVHDAGVDSGIYYYAMSYVEGESLAERLEREGALAEKESLGIVETVALALRFAWSRERMLHRDIKPANIMLDQDGMVKVLDMGLAKSILEESSLTMTGSIMGTPNYMSPEQALARADLDFRADVYSLGATLFHLVCGSPPYEGESVMSVLARLAHEEIPSPRSLNPDVSAACAALIQGMTAKAVEERYHSYDLLIGDIRRVQAGKMPRFRRKQALAERMVAPVPDAAKREAATGAPLFWSRRRMWGVAGGGLLLLWVMLGLLSQVDEKQSRQNKQQTERKKNGPSAAVKKITEKKGTKKQKIIAADSVAAKKKKKPNRVAKKSDASPDDFWEDPWGTRRAGGKAKQKGKQRSGAKTPSAIVRMGRLKSRMERLAQQGRLDEALRRLNQYRGPLAKETQLVRQRLAADLQDKYGDVRKDKNSPVAPKRKLKKSPVVLPSEKDFSPLDDMARFLLQNNFSAVAREIQKQPRRLKKNTRDGIELVKRVLRMPERIVESFRADQGKTVRVRFHDGKEEMLQILAVPEGGGVVKAQRVIKKGNSVIRMARNFSLSEVSEAEQASRLEKTGEPEVVLMVGLLAFQARNLAQARKAFTHVGGPLGEALLRQVDAVSRQQAVARSTAAYGDLCTALRLSAGEKEDTHLLTQLYARDFSLEFRRQIREMARDLRHRYPMTPVVRAHDRFLTELSEWGTVRLPFGCKAVKAKTLNTAGLLNGSAARKKQLVMAERMGWPVEIENKVGMRFCFIPPGTFTRENGSVVHLSAFYMGKFELTQKQWKQIMKTPAPGKLTGDAFPVESISWEQAQAFANKLNQELKMKTGHYRLPSEAEWEYACRAGSTGKWFFDPAARQLADFANYLDRSAPNRLYGFYLRRLKDRWHDDGYAEAAPVGSYRPNAWGLYDMYGNVYEWCLDWKAPYPDKEQSDPEGPENGRLRVHRGGSYLYPAKYCSSVYRHASPPAYSGGKRFYGNALGLRLVLVLP